MVQQDHLTKFRVRMIQRCSKTYSIREVTILPPTTWAKMLKRQEGDQSDNKFIQIRFRPLDPIIRIIVIVILHNGNNNGIFKTVKKMFRFSKFKVKCKMKVISACLMKTFKIHLKTRLILHKLPTGRKTWRMASRMILGLVRKL